MSLDNLSGVVKVDRARKRAHILASASVEPRRILTELS